MPKPASPLPHKYETYVQGSGENGIVLVAFGTHRSQLPEYVVVNMLTAFGKLKQRIIWKAECEKYRFINTKDDILMITLFSSKVSNLFPVLQR